MAGPRSDLTAKAVIVTPVTVGGRRLQLSARGFHRVPKVARTIADLDGAETVTQLLSVYGGVKVTFLSSQA